MGRKSGTKLTEEHKLNIAKSHKGMTHSDETKKKIANSHRKRISLSENIYDLINKIAIEYNISFKKCFFTLLNIGHDHYESKDFEK